MSDIWLEGFTRLHGKRTGATPRNGHLPSRIGLHTDEVGRNTRAMAIAHPNPPQLWVNPSTKERYQLIPLNKTGYALKASPYVETNHAGKFNVQIEIAGRADETSTWPEEWLQWLGEEVLRPIHLATGIPLTPFLPIGYSSAAAYGTKSRSRMARGEWVDFNGVYTHQNVPDNSHWDCGELNLGRVLSYATATPEVPPISPTDIEDDMLELLYDHSNWKAWISNGNKAIEVAAGDFHPWWIAQTKDLGRAPFAFPVNRIVSHPYMTTIVKELYGG